MRSIKVVFALVILVFFVSCNKEEEESAQDFIEGKWLIVSSELFGNEIPGDGSYLRFDGCGNVCSGMDYLASDSTSGSFTYILNENASIIAIVDTTSAGGSYNGNWDILELTNSDFRIVGSTIFGSLKIEMVKGG